MPEICYNYVVTEIKNFLTLLPAHRRGEVRNILSDKRGDYKDEFCK